MPQLDLIDIGTSPKGRPETYRQLAEEAERRGCCEVARLLREAAEQAEVKAERER